MNANPYSAPSRGDLSWLLHGEVLVRPWLLLALVGILSALAGANGWLVLRTRVQAAEVRALAAALQADGGIRP